MQPMINAYTRSIALAQNNDKYLENNIKNQKPKGRNLEKQRFKKAEA